MSFSCNHVSLCHQKYVFLLMFSVCSMSFCIYIYLALNNTSWIQKERKENSEKLVSHIDSKTQIQRFLCSRTTGGNGDNDEGQDNVEGAGQLGGPGIPTSPNQPGKPKRLVRKRHKTLANKPQDFQVLSEF